MMVSRLFLLLRVAAVVAVIASAAAIDAPAARAQCCEIGLSNNTICSYRVCVALPGRDTCYALPPGGATLTLPQCGDFPLYMVDICGNRVRFPSVINDCVRINMGTCCLLVCKLTECRYDVSYGHCEPCN